MKTLLKTFAVAIALLPLLVQAQTIPDLGPNASQFTIFTGTGALTNAGVSVVTGDVGTNNIGGYSGFTPGTVVGNVQLANTITANAALELDAAYNNFNATTTCGTVLSASVVGPQTFAPGVYCGGGATTISGDVILDANFDPSSVFIFKIGGALSVEESTHIILANGATLANVYFQVDGLVNLGDHSVFRGTIVSSGAISFLGDASLFGKALTMAGAISLQNSVVTGSAAPLPVTLISFAAKGEGNVASLSWATSEETNSDRFEIENSVDGKQWGKVGFVKASNESTSLKSYFYTVEMLRGGTNFFRLKMIDADQTFTYSRIRTVRFELNNMVSAYPNPVIDQLTLKVDGIGEIDRIQFSNTNGQVLYDQKKAGAEKLSEQIAVKNFPAGIYVIKITGPGGTVALKVFKL